MTGIHHSSAILLILFPLSALALVGCATTPDQCNPNNPDFFNNVSCLGSGAYAQRQRDLESTLASERSRNRAFETLLADLRTEQSAVKNDLRARQAALQRADASWRQLKAGLAAEANASPALATRVRQIDEDFARAQAGQVAERDALAKQVKLLQQELDAGLYD